MTSGPPCFAAMKRKEASVTPSMGESPMMGFSMFCQNDIGWLHDSGFSRMFHLLDEAALFDLVENARVEEPERFRRLALRLRVGLGRVGDHHLEASPVGKRQDVLPVLD